MKLMKEENISFLEEVFLEGLPYDEVKEELLYICVHCGYKEKNHFDFKGFNGRGESEYKCPKCNKISTIKAKLFIAK